MMITMHDIVDGFNMTTDTSLSGGMNFLLYLA
jgi:hypothetical protein